MGVTGAVGATGNTGATGATGVIGGSVTCSGTASAACAETAATVSATNPGLNAVLGPATAACAPGHILLGGGAATTNSGHRGAIGIIESRASTAGSGGTWTATGEVFVAPDAESDVMTITAQAICSN